VNIWTKVCVGVFDSHCIRDWVCVCRRQSHISSTSVV